ncbi:hypothetical protein DV735_g120, partial [Chaetothyriales sp. CBS 134920]
MALASPPATPPESISSPSSSTSSQQPPPSSLPALTRTLSHPPQTDFDVIAHYKNAIKSNPSLPVPIAAIESLVALLTHTPLTTVSETLALIDAQSLILRQWAANPIPISAGTDLFQRYLVASFQHRSTVPLLSVATLRAKLVATSKLFTSKAKIASQQVAANFLPLVVDDSLVFTHATTALVETVIRHAFNIPTSTLPLHSFRAALSSSSPRRPRQSRSLSSSILILSCHAVFSNGALLTPSGSHMLALAARDAGIPVYAAVESFNFVRPYPLSADAAELTKLGVKQRDLLASEWNHGTE